MLEKIKELRVKAECAKALLALADDEAEQKHFKKLLDKYKQELLKFLDEPQPKPSRAEPNEPKKLGAILAEHPKNLPRQAGARDYRADRTCWTPTPWTPRPEDSSCLSRQ